MHHGRGVEAARRRRRRRPPGRETPARAPKRTRPLAPTTAALAMPNVRRPPEGPERRQPPRHRQPPHTPPSAIFEAAGRGALRGRWPGGGAETGGTWPLPEVGPTPQPRPRPSGLYSREITAQRVG